MQNSIAEQTRRRDSSLQSRIAEPSLDNCSWDYDESMVCWISLGRWKTHDGQHASVSSLQRSNEEGEFKPAAILSLQTDQSADKEIDDLNDQQDEDENEKCFSWQLLEKNKIHHC